jgi:hypothetical protein
MTAEKVGMAEIVESEETAVARQRLDEHVAI